MPNPGLGGRAASCGSTYELQGIIYPTDAGKALGNVAFTRRCAWFIKSEASASVALRVATILKSEPCTEVQSNGKSCAGEC